MVKLTETSVRLLRKDGREIDVPINALSEADQTYLKSLADENPFEGGTPSVETTTPGSTAGPSNLRRMFSQSMNPRELPVGGKTIYLEIDRPVPPLTADPSPLSVEFKEFAVPLEHLDAYAERSPPILINPKGPVFAVSVHRVGTHSDPTTFGRIHLVSPNDRRSKIAIDVDQSIVLFDHHVATGRSLAVLGVDRPSERGGDIVLLDKLSTGAPSVITRWRLPEWNKPGFKPKVEFARLLDGERAVVQVNHDLYVWNLARGRVEYSFGRVRAGGKLELSGTGKYLAIPTSQGCRIVDLDEGELAGTVPFPSSLTPEPRFSPDGNRLALVGGNQFVVWDLTNGVIAAEATIEKPCGDLLGWIDNRYLLCQLGGLIDPELGVPLWNYYLPGTLETKALPGGVITVNGNGMAVVAVLPVPHGPVAQVAERMAENDESLTLLRPGSSVALKVDTVDGVDKQAMLSAIQAAIERAGWKVDPNAGVVLTATIERGEEQTLYFRSLGQSIFGPHETATIKPYTARLVIEQGDKTIWSRRSTNMVPSIIRLERGETLQQALKKYEVADPGYFNRLQLPPRLLRPEVSASIGRSTVDKGRWRDF